MKSGKKGLWFWVMFAVALMPLIAKSIPTVMQWINEAKAILSSMTAEPAPSTVVPENENENAQS